MAIRYAIEKHACGVLAKGLARTGGAHVYSFTLTDDTDNSWFLGKGDFIELDRYKDAAPTSFSGKVVAKAANGNWYVEVISAENAYFVASVAMIEEDYSNKFKLEENFYNPAGSEARVYTVCPGDILEISTDGFTATPAVNDTVSLKTIVGATYAMKLGK